MNSIGIIDPGNARKLFPARKETIMMATERGGGGATGMNNNNNNNNNLQQQDTTTKTTTSDATTTTTNNNNTAKTQSDMTQGGGASTKTKVKAKAPSSSSSYRSEGIMKTKWFEKHNKCRPACVALFVEYEDFVGDPNAWTQVCSSVDQVVAAAKTRSARTFVVVIRKKEEEAGQTGGGEFGYVPELPEDRVTAIKRRLDPSLDPKYVVSCNLSEEGDLACLAKILHELAGQYYRDLIKRFRVCLGGIKNKQQNAKLCIRWSIKVGALCEFCQDWKAALAAYQQAYSLVGDLFTWSSAPQGTDCVHYLQDIRETLCVAEALLVKIALLLLIQHHWATKQQEQHSNVNVNVNGAANGGNHRNDAAATTSSSSTDNQYLQEAIHLFQHHISAFRLPLGRNPSVLKQTEDLHGVDLVEVFDAVHWDWVSAQYRKFAKLLMERTSSHLLLQLGSHPSHYQACAAQYAVLRRQCYESSKSRKMTTSTGDLDATGDGNTNTNANSNSKDRVRARFAKGAVKVTPGEFLGQWEITTTGLTEGEDPNSNHHIGIPRRMSECEFLCFLEHSESEVRHSDIILELLRNAQVLYGEIGLRRHTLKVKIDLADEYVRLDRVEEAQGILLGVAEIYRQEGWESPLADVVLRLRKCAQLLRKTREHVLHSFELCALKSVMDEDQRIAVFQSAQAVLITQQEELLEREPSALISRASFVFDLSENDALKTCFSCNIGFRALDDQIFLGSHVDVLVALKSKAPLPLEITCLRLQFTDPGCTKEVMSSQSSSTSTSTGGGRIIEVVGSDGKEVEQTSIVLNSDQYHKYLFRITPQQIGHLKCSRAELLLGDSALLIWDFESGHFDSSSGGGLNVNGASNNVLKDVGSDPLSRMAGIVPNHRGIVVEDLNVGMKVSLLVKSKQVLADSFTRVQALIQLDDLKVEEGEDLRLAIEIHGVTTDDDEAVTNQGVHLFRHATSKWEEYNTNANEPIVLPAMQPHSSVTQDLVVHCTAGKDFLLVARVLHKAHFAEAAITLKPQPAFRFESALKCSPYEFPLLMKKSEEEGEGEGEGEEEAETNNIHQMRAVSVPSDGSPFVVFVGMHCLSESSLDILGYDFEASDGTSLWGWQNPVALEQSTPTTLSEHEVFSAQSFCKVLQEGLGFKKGACGMMRVRWRPSDEPASAFPGVATTKMVLPTVVATPLLGRVKLDYNPVQVVATCSQFTVSYSNLTGTLQDLDLEVVDSGNFVFGGYRSSSLQILPFEKQVQTWYPVATSTGMLKLPEVKVSVRWGETTSKLTLNFKAFVSLM
jgi:hypothetical protein